VYEEEVGEEGRRKKIILHTYTHTHTHEEKGKEETAGEK
jgi:hypothetical protein